MTNHHCVPLASMPLEPRRDGPQGPIASPADLSRLHYRVAERINSCAAWQSQVLNAAAVIGAERVPYLTLVQRAQQILMMGATYTVKRYEGLITYGASLIHPGGYMPIGMSPVPAPEVTS